MEYCTKWDPQEIMAAVLGLGERVMASGGEVSRVEDTVSRLMRAYGARRVDVFIVTSSIVVTADWPGFGPRTQTRRVTARGYDLVALRELNSLSRRVCAAPLSPGQLLAGLKAIDELPHFSLPVMALIWAMASGSFTVFFGGSLGDTLWACGVAVLLKLLNHVLGRVQLNNYFSIILCSLFGGAMARLPHAFGLELSTALISMGNIMLLIPGVGFTNSIRDMFSGQTISGLMRCLEAIFLGMAIAWGFALSAAASPAPVMAPLWLALLAGFLGCIGFGMAFNLRGMDLFLGGLGGLVGCCAMLTLRAFCGKPLALFVAGVLVTLWCEVFARVRRCPVTVFLVVGIIAMVPGSTLYRTMRFAISSAWDSFAHMGLETLMSAAAIAAGIVCVTALADAWQKARPAPRRVR